MQPKCDGCGRFVSWIDISRGHAKVEMVTPDSAYTTETYETLCPRCLLEEKLDVARGETLRVVADELKRRADDFAAKSQEAHLQWLKGNILAANRAEGDHRAAQALYGAELAVREGRLL